DSKMTYYLSYSYTSDNGIIPKDKDTYKRNTIAYRGSYQATDIRYQTRGTLKERPWKEEGFENSEWILMDYVDVVVHIFLPEAREFYKLEQLWADAETKSIENKQVEK
ncbi:MAG: RsfS/YbeB/iojap family protein, partial [Bacteroidales bacterium]|nr:RsfS/YbeB/iojap family protein [Bacteroidales bacterium]